MTERLDPRAARDAWLAFASSRLLVLVSSLVGVHLLAHEYVESKITDPRVVHPFGGWPLGRAFDFFLSPLVRWDAVWYLGIARDGYHPPHVTGIPLSGRPAFFPLYPFSMRVLSGFDGTAPALIAGTLISLGSFLGALYLLHRLTTIELGPDSARSTVFLIAFFPFAGWFFSAPYTESLFLLLSVGCIYAARTGHWATAAALGALASATRNIGVLLLIPLVLLYLRERAGPLWRRLDRRVLWLALAPTGLIAYSLYLREKVGDAQAWRHAEAFFGKPDVVPPWDAAWQGTTAMVKALGGDAPHGTHAAIVIEWVVLVLVLIAIVGALRRLPVAYGLYGLAVLVPSISAPAVYEPLRSLPRYMMAVFPLFMWFGDYVRRRGWTRPLVVASAAGLAVLTAEFASWHSFV